MGIKLQQHETIIHPISDGQFKETLKFHLVTENLRLLDKLLGDLRLKFQSRQLMFGVILFSCNVSIICRFQFLVLDHCVSLKQALEIFRWAHFFDKQRITKLDVNYHLGITSLFAFTACN
jgi:hypothetical protein